MWKPCRSVQLTLWMYVHGNTQTHITQCHQMWLPFNKVIVWAPICFLPHRLFPILTYPLSILRFHMANFFCRIKRIINIFCLISMKHTKWTNHRTQDVDKKGRHKHNNMSRVQFNGNVYNSEQKIQCNDICWSIITQWNTLCLTFWWPKTKTLISYSIQTQ